MCFPLLSYAQSLKSSSSYSLLHTPAVEIPFSPNIDCFPRHFKSILSRVRIADVTSSSSSPASSSDGFSNDSGFCTLGAEYRHAVPPVALLAHGPPALTLRRGCSTCPPPTRPCDAILHVSITNTTCFIFKCSSKPITRQTEMISVRITRYSSCKYEGC